MGDYSVYYGLFGFAIFILIIGQCDFLPFHDDVNTVGTCVDKQVIHRGDGLNDYIVTFKLDDDRILTTSSHILGMENTEEIYSKVDLNKRYSVDYEIKTYVLVNQGGLKRINNATPI